MSYFLLKNYQINLLLLISRSQIIKLINHNLFINHEYTNFRAQLQIKSQIIHFQVTYIYWSSFIHYICHNYPIISQNRSSPDLLRPTSTHHHHHHQSNNVTIPPSPQCRHSTTIRVTITIASKSSPPPPTHYHCLQIHHTCTIHTP